MSGNVDTILVTGGAGFLGSHLIDKLIERENHVICLDNLSTGSENNIRHHYSNNNFQFVHHDISISFDIEADKIFNLACPASPIHYQADPIQTVKTCVAGAINVLDLAVKYGATVFHASTSEVYGDPLVHPQNESYVGNVNPIGIRSCYDEGKRCAETLFFDYRRQHNIDIRVARIFNTYGPRMDSGDGRVVSNFIVQALRGKELTVYGDGSQTRSFCYVDDLIEGFLRFMDIRSDDNRVVSGPINLGNPDEFTILELAEKVLAYTMSSSPIARQPLPKDDPKQRRPDISLAREALDSWSPKVALDEGLMNTIAYFKTIL